MPIVIDANIAVDWFVLDSNDRAESALDLVVAEGAIVPALWRWEVQNALRRLESAGRLRMPADFIRSELRELPIVIDSELTSLFGAEATIAKKFNLTVYDAAYLELALRRHLNIATSDRALEQSARSAGVYFGT